MRKFFIKAFSFVLGLSLIFNVLGTVADRVAPLEAWRVEQRQKVENLESRREQIEAITLGNSHGNAIEYSVLRLEGQSLALANADLFEVEKYAEVVVNELPNLKTVFIAISYHSFSTDNATFEPFRTRRARFYSLVPTWSPIHGDMYNFVLGKVDAYTNFMSVMRSDNWQGVWAGLAGDGKPVNLLPVDGVVTKSVWGTCVHYTAEQLETHARIVANRNVTNSLQMAVVHQGLEQDAFDALVRTIERLQSKGIRVVLFTPTFYEKYTEYFTESGSNMIDNMQKKVEILQQRYKVEYYDFSNDPEIREHPELFYNSNHLGNCGQRVFSEKLLQELNEHSAK